ncbi:MAG: hypothetical protein LRY50_08805 [Geovibrio sp.]|nr:hypothetical protein [Geovibrio sp.]
MTADTLSDAFSRIRADEIQKAEQAVKLSTLSNGIRVVSEERAFPDKKIWMQAYINAGGLDDPPQSFRRHAFHGTFAIQ